MRADLFETIDFTGTGAGYDMTAASFSFLSLHGAVQACDINGDQLADVVILADGRPGERFSNPRGWIPPTHYLHNPINLAVAGSSSPNVLAGIVGAPNSTFIQYTGGDPACQNNGNGYFEPCFVNLNTGNPPEIYNGKNLQVADLDGDSDNDIVVWASTGNNTTDFALGAGRVAWFESIPLTTNKIQFKQFNAVDPWNTPGHFSVGLTSYSVDDTQAGTLVNMNLDGKLDLAVLAHGGALSGNQGYTFLKTMEPDRVCSAKQLGMWLPS
ncbi:MAG: hypothetical protein IPP35_12420 [Elusimicrobia bacterium]|nr:hypothetical protein [Elusimicrobiota bacterium]